MYFINDKNAAARQIEEYLYKIGEDIESIPHVSIDGELDNTAKEAIREIQKKYGYAETGVADNATFLLLKRLADDYDARRAIGAQTYGINAYPLMLFDQNHAVLHLNELISQLSLYYDLPPSNANNLFSHATFAAVTELQRIFCLEENGAADAAFIARLENELISREKFA